WTNIESLHFANLAAEWTHSAAASDFVSLKREREPSGRPRVVAGQFGQLFCKSLEAKVDFQQFRILDKKFSNRGDEFGCLCAFDADHKIPSKRDRPLATEPWH